MKGSSPRNFVQPIALQSTLKERAVMLLAVVSLGAFLACGERPVTYERPENQEFVSFKGGRITLDQFLDAYKADGNLAVLAGTGLNETQWSYDYLNDLSVDFTLALQAEKADLAKSATAQRALFDLSQKTLLDEFFRREVDARIHIGPNEIRKEYEANRRSYTTPAQNVIRLIYCEGPITNAEARAKAQEKIRNAKDALDRGQKFIQVARLMSDEPYATRGVDKGPYSPGEIPIVAVDEAIQKLQPGEYSDIIESEKGFHIINLVKRTEEYVVPLTQMETTIRNDLFTREQGNRKAELFQELRKHYAKRISVRSDLLSDPAASASETLILAGNYSLSLKDFQEIRQIKGLVSQEQVDEQIQAIIDNYLALTRARELRLDKDLHVQRILAIKRIRYLANAIAEATLTPSTIPTEEEIHEEFVRDPAPYRIPARVHAYELFVKIRKNEDMYRHQVIQAEKDAEQKIRYLIEKIREGEDFITLATNYSERSSAAQGGDIGWITPGQNFMYDDIFFSLRQLKDGEITTLPIKSQTGYYIFYASEWIPAQDRLFTEVRDEVRDHLQRSRLEEAKREYRERIRQEIDIRIETDALLKAGEYLINSCKDLQSRSLF